MRLVKLCWLLGCCLLFEIAQAQYPSAPLQTQQAKYISETKYLRGMPGPFFSGIHADQVVNYRYTSPWLTTWSAAGGQPYWIGGTTTQSFNHGKFGTIYFYDNQGNMRYASPFIDISGKNKRGLKLLLPTINQRMFR